MCIRDRLHHAEIFFSNVLGRLLMRAGMEYSYPLRHSARHLDKDFSRNTANKQGLQESLRPLMDMCAKAEQAAPPERTLLKDCGEFRTNWDGIVSNWTQLARGHVEAKQLWNTLDGKLRELSDAVSTHEAEWIYRSMSHINEEVSRIKDCLLYTSKRGAEAETTTRHQPFPRARLSAPAGAAGLRLFYLHQ